MNISPDQFRHPKCGVPSQSYVYREETGQPVLVANRYDKPGGGKFFLPFDVLKGEWKAPEVRPVYNLDRIACADRDTPIILVEGEKCADALTGLGFLATTTFGGSNAFHRADIAPLAGRKVIIWPDMDESGEKYLKAVKSGVQEFPEMHVFALSISDEMLRNLPHCDAMSAFARGWDAADAVADGWTRQDVENLLKTAISCQSDSVNFPKCPEMSDIGLELWHSPEKEAFASIVIGNHVENWPLDSSDFRNFLSYEHYKAEGKMLSASALDDRRRALAGEAIYGGREYPVFTRIGHHHSDIHLDLGNREWSSVAVSRSGWQVVKSAPVRFQRARSTQALPDPVAGGDVDQLRPFLNVGSDIDFRMLVAWLLGCFHPKGPYPILILTGEQGSAKSTTAIRVATLKHRIIFKGLML